MAEAVGLASGLLALTVAAYKTSKSLYEAVSSFQSHRKTIKDIQADSKSLITVLGKIHEQIQSPHDVERLEPLRQPLNCCKTACQEMHEMLDACTIHGTDDRNSVRDWLSMRYREKSFKDMKQRLLSYKSTLSIAFDLIMVQDHSSIQDSLEGLKESISGTKEDLEDQLAQVQRTVNNAEASLREVLQDDQARLQSCLNSLTQAQKIADGIHPSIVVQRNRAGQGSRAIFGTDTSQPQFNLTVSDNEAQPHAVMGSGVYTPQTLQALLGGSRTADLALAVQALQTQTQSTDGTSSRANPPLSLMDSDHTNTAEDFHPPPCS
ncbi:hypothetical protein ABVK25_000084 [Lepraria finkii]|uniref:Azaphilone pigments biosynthesis cluster protein L N-terminal domain-containing protein n=1 Tax=Lepraria finkii TaxID=1340010 RepID=A0ABR4BR86_9LECA